MILTLRICRVLRQHSHMAERRIGELQNVIRYDHPGLMMIVKDEARQTVLSLPFLAGCA